MKLTKPIIDFMRAADIDSPILHLVYYIWGSMIEKVKEVVFIHKEKDQLIGHSDFFNTIHQILETRWNNSNTPLHCLAHALVPRYYIDSWLHDGDSVERFAPHEDQGVSINQVKYFKRLFPNPEDLKKYPWNMVNFLVELVISVIVLSEMQGHMKNQYHGGLIKDLSQNCCNL